MNHFLIELIMKKNILWFQDPDNKANNVISVDGDVLTAKSSNEYDEYYKILYSLDKKTQKISTKTTTISKVDNGLFIKGYFSEKDNLGRNIGFMFFTDSSNVDEVINRLKHETQLHKMNCTDETFIEIKSWSYKQTLTSILILISIVATISILYALFK